MARSTSDKRYFLFAKNREMEHNFERISISSNDNEFSDASVESFGGLVSSLFDLFERGTLRDKIVYGRR